MAIRSEVIWRGVLVVIIVLAIVALIAFARGQARHGPRFTVHIGEVSSALGHPGV